MKTHSVFVAAALLPFVAGCATNLRTGSLAASSPTELPVGFVYYLPAATVAPTASLRIEDCPVDAELAQHLRQIDGRSIGGPLAELRLAVAGDIAIEQVRGQPVVIDYRELGGFLKTTNLSMERQPNGMLKSVGVTVEDQTPAVLADLAVAAGNVAMIGLGAPPVPMAPFIGNLDQQQGAENLSPSPEPVSYLACRPLTVALLAERRQAADSKVKTTQELEQISAAMAQFMRDKDLALGPGEIEELRRLRSSSIALTNALATVNKSLADLDAKLSVKLTPPQDTDVLASVTAPGSQGLSLSVADKVLEAFVDRHYELVSGQIMSSAAERFRKRPCSKQAGVSEVCDNPADVVSFLKPRAVAVLSAKKVSHPANGHSPFQQAALPGNAPLGRVPPGTGIVYVEPATYTLTLKQQVSNDPLTPATTLKELPASIPQMGTYLTLPVRAGFGEKVTLSATFNPDGSLATASYGHPASLGKAVSGSIAGLTGQYLTTYDAMQERKLKLLKAQAEQLTAQKSILTAQNALNDDPLAEINAQIATITAQAMLAEATLRLNAANAKLTSP